MTRPGQKPPVRRAHTRTVAPSNAAPGMGQAFARLARQAKNARRRQGIAAKGQMPPFVGPEDQTPDAYGEPDYGC